MEQCGNATNSIRRSVLQEIVGLAVLGASDDAQTLPLDSGFVRVWFGL